MKIVTNYLISLFRGFGKEQGLERFGNKVSNCWSGRYECSIVNGDKVTTIAARISAPVALSFVK